MSEESRFPPLGAVPPAIQTVADVLNRHGVRWLLMGGLACVAYGASEFTRNVDIVVLADSATVAGLRSALAELDAVVIAVPPFELASLEAGHAVHFRCRAAAVDGAVESELERLLDQEMHAERAADREHWAPLKQELERMRLGRRRDSAVDGP